MYQVKPELSPHDNTLCMLYAATFYKGKKLFTIESENNLARIKLPQNFSGKEQVSRRLGAERKWARIR